MALKLYVGFPSSPLPTVSRDLTGEVVKKVVYISTDSFKGYKGYSRSGNAGGLRVVDFVLGPKPDPKTEADKKPIYPIAVGHGTKEFSMSDVLGGNVYELENIFPSHRRQILADPVGAPDPTVLKLAPSKKD